MAAYQPALHHSLPEQPSYICSFFNIHQPSLHLSSRQTVCPAASRGSHCFWGVLNYLLGARGGKFDELPWLPTSLHCITLCQNSPATSAHFSDITIEACTSPQGKRCALQQPGEVIASGFFQNTFWVPGASLMSFLGFLPACIA